MIVNIFNELKKSFFEKLTEEEWFYIYENARPETKPKKRALIEIEKRITTFDGWIKKYKNHRHIPPTERLCFQKIISLSNTSDLIKLCGDADQWSDFETELLEKTI